MSYEKNRPAIPANIRRQIEIEAGHRCSVNHCIEHLTEIHHIDGNRENNEPSNLVLLCLKHHKLAHDGNISRMDLKAYKSRLNTAPQLTQPQTNTNHDRRVLERINTIFPHDTLMLIRNESFGKFVPSAVIDPINLFIVEAEDPLAAFTSPHLEELRKIAVYAAWNFIRHFGQQSGGRIGGYDYIDIPHFRKISQNVDVNYWYQYSEKTCDLARLLCDAISNLRAEMRNF